MRHLLLLSLLAFLPACTVLRSSPVIPDGLLTCQAAPSRPEATNQAVAAWINDLWFSAEDCRSKLSQVKGLVNGGH